MEARLLGQIKPFIVMEVLERANELQKQGIDIIHMEVGEPDFDVPECVKEACEAGIRSGYTHYTHSLGDPELREAISRHYKNTYGVSVKPEQILVTSGTSPGILLALSVLLNAGDEVILSDPGYACYANFVTYAGGKPVTVPVDAANGFQYTPEGICEKLTHKTKAILINSPMNPTGNLLTPETMKAIAQYSPYIISDEIYHGLVYGEKAHSILEFTDKAFVLNGFSKLYAMTGLRLGYLIAPEKYMRHLQILQQNLFICANSVAQRAGIAALEKGGPNIERMRLTYDKRRKFLIRRLRELGFTIPVEPTGAFYIFVDASHLSNDSYKLAFDMLEKAHIGVTPGIDFGANGEGYLRFSYANSLENLVEGMRRLENYLHNFNGLDSGDK